MDEKNDVRERIVDAAGYLFMQNGYHATGLNEILGKSKAPKGSLYYYFPYGKEQLVQEAIRKKSDAMIAIVNKIMDSYDNPEEALRHTLEYVIDYYRRKEFKETVSIGFLAKELSAVDEGHREFCVDVIREIRLLFRDRLLSAGFNGEKADDISHLCMNMIEGAMLRVDISRTLRPLEVVVENLHVMFR